MKSLKKIQIILYLLLLLHPFVLEVSSNNQSNLHVDTKIKKIFLTDPFIKKSNLSTDQVPTNPEAIYEILENEKLLPIIDYKSINETISLVGHSGGVISMDFSPDGSMLASGAVGSSGDQLKIWNMTTNSLITTTGSCCSTTALAFSPDGSILAIGTETSPNLVLLNSTGNFNTIDPIAQLGTNDESAVSSLSFSPKGSTLAAGLGTPSGETIKIWNIREHAKIKGIVANQDAIDSVDYSPDGKILASTGIGPLIKLWKSGTYSEMTNITIGGDALPRPVSFSPNGSLIASAYFGGGVGEVRLWDTTSNSQIPTLMSQDGRISEINFSPNRNVIASATENEIKLWDLSNYKELKTLSIQNRLLSLSFSPDGSKLAYGLENNSIKILKFANAFSFDLNEPVVLNNGEIPFSSNSSYQLSYAWGDQTFQNAQNDKIPTPDQFGLRQLNVRLNENSYTISGSYYLFLTTDINDPDLDGIPSVYEKNFGLNPYYDDSLEDLDGDGLNNLEEFIIGTLPNNSDTDSDGMNDGYEISNDLDPFIDDSQEDKDNDGLPNWYEAASDLRANDSSDALLDSDNDGLNNIDEYNYGTLSNTNDTDGDFLSDKYEFDHLLNGTNVDTDSDGIHDGYEVFNDLDPLFDDSAEDKDNDGLTNLQEFEWQTMANNSDTDSDGMLDGWEVNNNLDPLIDDSNLDNDGDGLTNLEEFNYGTDPNNADTDGDGDSDKLEIDRGFDPLDPNNSFTKTRNILIGVGIVGLILLAVFVNFLSINLRKWRENRIKLKAAKERKYSSFDQLLKGRELGFQTGDQQGTANQQGFKTSKTQSAVLDLEYQNSKDFINGLNSINDAVINIKDKISLDKIEEELNQTSSPIELTQLEENLNQNYLDPLQSILSELKDHHRVLKELEEELERIGENIFVDTAEIDIVETKENFNRSIKEVSRIEQGIINRIEKRREWLKPYNKLLEVMQKTQEGIPVSLARLAELSEATKEQAEELITLLVSAHPEIGEYMKFEQVYMRGENVGSAIDDLLKEFKDHESDKTGKFD